MQIQVKKNQLSYSNCHTLVLKALPQVISLEEFYGKYMRLSKMYTHFFFTQKSEIKY